MRKAVAYYRVSTDRQGKSGLGLSAQKRMIYQYCKANKIVLVKEYKEIKSGESDEKRPMVQKAITYCLQHDMLLLVAKQSRLGRSVLFISGLIKRHLDFVSVDNPSANNLQKHIQAAFDEHYLDEVRSNTKLSLQAAIRKGKRLGGNPKKLIRTLRRQRKAYLRIIKPVFKKIQKEYSTVRDITNELNRLKVKTFRGKRGGWHVSTVHKTLTELSPNK